MEQNTQIIAKKMWNLMRVAYYMLKKGICKRKILLDLNLVMKRGKLAGKALQKIMFHLHHHQQHQHQHQHLHQHHHQRASSKPEFDIVNSPSHLIYMSTPSPFFHTPCSSFEEMNNNNNNVFDMLNISGKSSPALLQAGLGLRSGKNSRVKQIRITDSPFPIQNEEDNGIIDNNIKHVDEAAEDFINKFYSKLKNQKYYD